MKKIVFTLMMILGVTSLLQAQVTQEELNRARQEAENATTDKKKKEKAYESLLKEVRYQNALIAIEENDFVIEAERITFKRGNWRYVTANTNFISLKGDEATVQIAFPGAPAGPNGIGGITLDGRATSIKKTTDKKGRTNISMQVTGAGISARIEISMHKGDANVTAIVSPNFSSNRFTLEGTLYPTSESNVFKGRSF